MTVQVSKVPDRRVARTQKLLRDALHSLIRERDYDSIAVKEILDRANVGRSAFYTHFRDKDELLASSIYDILGSVPSTHPKTDDGRNERILWFSLPIFEHHDRHRRAGELRLGPRGRAVLHGQLQKVLVELIAEDIRKSLQGRRKAAALIPPELLGRYVASTFILVLNWWVESRNPRSQVTTMPISFLDLTAEPCGVRDLPDFFSLPSFPNFPTKGRHSARIWYHWYHLPSRAQPNSELAR